MALSKAHHITDEIGKIDMQFEALLSFDFPLNLATLNIGYTRKS